jgi:hypothetical protein
MGVLYGGDSELEPMTRFCEPWHIVAVFPNTGHSQNSMQAPKPG